MQRITGFCVKKQPKTIHWQVEFDGILQSDVRASIIQELIKFIVFERRQLPGAFNVLKQQELEEKKDHCQRDMPFLENHQNGVSGNNMKIFTAKGRQTQIQDTKLRKCIDGLDRILVSVRDAFLACDHIRSVTLLIGPTLVSPKETFVFLLPELGIHQGESLSKRRCFQAIARKLISQDIFDKLPSIGPTNIHVLVQAPSTAHLPHLEPMFGFSLTGRGQRFELEILCTCKVTHRELPDVIGPSSKSPDHNQSRTVDDDDSGTSFSSPILRLLADCDISGVGLLETTLEEDAESTVKSSSDSGMDVCQLDTLRIQPASPVLAAGTSELIWYKIPGTVKGAKGKAVVGDGMGWLPS